MVSLAGFDSFGSFMRGKAAAQSEQDRERQLQRDEEDRAFQQSERQYQTQRRGVLDERADTTWGQQQEDRVEDRDWQKYVRGAQKQDRAFQLERRPIETQQRDQLHNLNVRGAQQGMNIRAAQEGRAAARDQMQMQMAELQLDDANLKREHRDFAAKIGAPARRFAITGDTKEISAVFREVAGGEGELVKKDDGTYAIATPEGETPIGTRDDVMNVLATFAQSPEAYLNLRYQAATGGVRNGGKLPASVQEIEYIAKRMPRLEGESDQDHFMRAAEFVKRTGVRDPEVEFRSTMLKIMDAQRAETGRADRDAAVEEARYIMGQKLSPSRPGGGQARSAGQTQDDPIDVTTLASKPPPGTWVKLPNGNVMQIPN